MINTQINELVAYGLKCGLVSKDDQIFVTNQLLDLFRLSEFHEEEILKSRPLAEILEDMVSYAHQQEFWKKIPSLGKIYLIPGSWGC